MLPRHDPKCNFSAQYATTQRITINNLRMLLHCEAVSLCQVTSGLPPIIRRTPPPHSFAHTYWWIFNLSNWHARSAFFWLLRILRTATHRTHSTNLFRGCCGIRNAQHMTMISLNALRAKTFVHLSHTTRLDYFSIVFFIICCMCTLYTNRFAIHKMSFVYVTHPRVEDEVFFFVYFLLDLYRKS